jgi:hypothetical protein
VGFTFQFENHAFYVLTFPTADKTWVYDINTNLWHQWTYYNSATGQEHRSKCVYQSYFIGKNYTLAHDDAKVYELDMETYTDDGAEIVRVRSTPHIHNDRKNIRYDRFELDMERGVGLVSGQGSVPQVALQISNDGGYTFGNEMWRSMGAMGKYLARAHWNQLGVSRDRVFKITITDPVKVVLINASINYSLGRT